ncbi:saccharopine dehydrogenase [Nocardia panacis]|uniref:Saccharopine dehydrogenase n=1 Tax=Nocardia panacis TaxID=2340916 RepID=A0A3A4KKK6_9NOCA|nr:saccharopine dehydrogenase NADP-binding domain-containing protein [Nocardia panacis]RJO75592.1 saccharopine dehydrogenase [Nocardia panacis]
MRILILEATEPTATAALTVARRVAGVREIIAADTRGDAVRALVDSLGRDGAPVRAEQLDPDDRQALREALTSADIVLNAADPSRFGTRVLAHAIDSGTDYLDICDDTEITSAMLEFDPAAKRAGVCAVIGMGASPGLDNLLAACAARELDTVHNIHTAWPIDTPDPNPTEFSIPPTHPTDAEIRWTDGISGEITVVRAGEHHREPPLRPIPLELPGDLRGTAYTVGHPAPLTLARTLTATGDCLGLLTLTPGTAAYLDVLRRDIDRGRLTRAGAAAQLTDPSLRRSLRALARAMRLPEPGNLPPFFALVTGHRAGEGHTVLATLREPATGTPLTTDLARADGIPIALAIAHLDRERPGVHPPEAIIDPDRFFYDLDTHLLGPTHTPSLVLRRNRTTRDTRSF